MQNKAGGWPKGVSAGHSRRWKGSQHPVSETWDGGDARLCCLTLLALSCSNTLCLSVIFTSGRVIFTS